MPEYTSREVAPGTPVCVVVVSYYTRHARGGCGRTVERIDTGRGHRRGLGQVRLIGGRAARRQRLGLEDRD